MKISSIARFFASALFTGAAIAAPSQEIRSSGPAPPSQDSFYTVPDNIATYAPGAIIKHRQPPSEIAAFGISKVNLQSTYQILYRTTDNHGNATATVVSVLVPHNADMGKVLSYQVAEDAASIDCAPSYAFQFRSATGPLLGTIVTQLELLLIEAALEQGWVVIVPDFLGPKASYLANKLAGHATLDGIRATISSTSFTGVRSDPNIVMWGYSGGSVATNWAAELQPTYAPELRILGAAVGGTVPKVSSVVRTINKGPLAGFIPAGIMGMISQYPELRDIIESHLKPSYSEKFHTVLHQCLAATAARFAFDDVLSEFTVPNLILTDPTATRILNENDLGLNTPAIPFFWYKSIFDEVSPIDDTDDLVDSYCNRGVSIEYWRDLLSEHGAAAATGAPKALSWLKERLDGKAPATGCSTKSKASSLLDLSTAKILPKFILDAVLDLLAHKPVGPLIG
ncbi:hypothetical protein VHEMI09519 [[Torrubiella] hemipterigena]|uniref:Secretory lipase family protein n=1 Tax=[Torrubiella] hemipterigena TaxID=1531966 RepID=A0A0A1TRM3_9HYPO|nr:hypothetical protein VHEMI09519 [[Torrubiella] hemipterigena]